MVKVELAPIADLVVGAPKAVKASAVSPVTTAVTILAPLVSDAATAPVATVVAEAALGTSTSANVNCVVY